MTNRCIANEILRLLPHDNLFALVSDCARELGYYASPIFRNDARLPYQIALFAMDRREETHGDMTEAGTVMVTPIPPNMRVQVFCQVWQTPIPFSPGFTPCEVSAEVMRYLLRVIEGHDRANAWRPPWEKSDALSDLLKPIVVNWRVSELKRWTEDYAADYGLSIGFFQLVNGIQINQDIAPSALVSFDGQRLEEGRILLTPVLNDAARAMPAAVAELRRWRSALEAATAVIAPIEVDPAALGIRAKQLGVRPDTLMRWERILQVHLPKGLTQAQIGELEDRDIETIKNDYERMRAKGLMPPLPEKPTLKLTP